MSHLLILCQSQQTPKMFKGIKVIQTLLSDSIMFSCSNHRENCVAQTPTPDTHYAIYYFPLAGDIMEMCGLMNIRCFTASNQ